MNKKCYDKWQKDDLRWRHRGQIIYIYTHMTVIVNQSSYVCDTLLALGPGDAMHVQHVSSSSEPCARPPQQPPRKLCVRHQRMADEGTNLKLQQVCGLPDMTLLLTRANSRWMSCRSRSESRSTPSGRHSPRRPIPGAL